jgi:hypothetical protein
MKLSLETRNVLREALAAYAHDAWSRWVTHFFKQCESDPLSRHLTLRREDVERWSRQVLLRYDQLTSKERESDLKEADCMLDIVERRI